MNRSNRLRTALVAVGGSLAAVPAAALELGKVNVHSTLGQPLRASIAYALAPNETMADTCVSLVAAPAASGLPSISRASITAAEGVIAISSNKIVRDPLVTMRISIRCPYTPRLTREYTLLVDPVQAPPQVQRNTESAPVVAPVRAPAVSRRVEPAPLPVTVGTRYQVQPHESLSEIAQRIVNRPVGLWTAVDAIFEANPDAFLDSDVNQLIAGSWLIIPDLTAAAPVPVADAPAEFTAPAEEPTPVEPEFSGTAYVPDPVAELRPGDVIIDDSIVIPDTVIEGPAATSSQPKTPLTIIRRPEEPEPAATDWLVWLIGGGIALISGLLLFGRLRERFGSTPIGAPSARSAPRPQPQDTEVVEAIGDIDIEIDDDSPTAENLALDADLISGDGLQQGTDVDMSNQFAFASTTSLDMEFPDETDAGEEKPETDIIPPPNIDTESILESEVLPEMDEDDYDMSVIIDATKMPNPEDVTERDLEAIQVPDDDETLITDDYTVSQEADYNILEQDYEDELSATQALNAEIQKAAEDLAIHMDEAEASTEAALASLGDLDVTAELQSSNDDDISDDDDTGLNPTVSMDTEGDTVEMPKDGTKAG